MYAPKASSKRSGPEYLLAQQNQAERRLEVTDCVAGPLADLISGRKDRRGRVVGENGQDLVHRVAAAFGVFRVAFREHIRRG